MRRVTYPVPEGAINDTTAATIREKLEAGIGALRDGTSPVFEAVPDYPNTRDDDAWVSAFRDEVETLASWGQRIAGIRAIADPRERKAKALELRDELQDQRAMPDSVYLEILGFLRDATSDWEVVLDWIAKMPDYLRTRPDTEEQRLLALAKLKSEGLEERVGALKKLIDDRGPSSERCGLLGGRYKDLYDRTCHALETLQEPSERARLELGREDYLDSAIEAYHRGMRCDLNDYYPSCNLPGLLRIRGRDGDAELARTAAGITAVACQRAKDLGSRDPWLNPTLLLAAFQAEDAPLSTELARQVRQEGPAVWQLESALKDLRRSVEQIADGHTKEAFKGIVEQLTLLQTSL
jgi:hypothetical protein